MQQESIDSIIVLLRIRPFNEKERQEEAQPCFKIDDHSKNTVIFDGASKGEARYFTFDHVCPEQIHQEEIFRIVGIPTARSCLQGYNGCIFAYGQTGAGKTYTIQGQGLDINVNESLPLEVKEEIGLLPRVVDYMFSDIASAHDTSSNIVYSVKCNYLEIYNEHIIDLLNPSVKNLQVREDLKRGVHVEGITEELCSNASQTMDLLLRGNRNRHIGSTNLNIESSRSHSVFTFSVEGKVTQDGITRIRTSQFSFVDLAGSERQKVVGTAGERLKEGCLINKSLMVLANVINSLVDISEGKSRFVHYRDSKLTFLLKYSLGGNAKTSVIANISPASTSYIETLSTLKFAQRAKLIKNKVRVNEDTSGTLESLKNEIFRLRQELATMRNIFHIGGIKYDDYKRDPNRLGFESDQGSVSNRFMYESLDNQETRETRETQKSNELERLLKQSLDLLRESETHLLSELGKKEDVIDKLQSEQEATGKQECQMKMVIKLLYDKVERYKAILAKKMITAKDCIDVINEEHRNDLRKKVVQALTEPQADLQKSQMNELDETREENIRIKQEYKRLIELLTQKDDEIAKLSSNSETRTFNRSKSPSKSPIKKGQSVKIGTNKGVKGGEGRIKDEYDELVKEYMNACEKLEDREQDVQQMRQDFENLEAEKKEMMDNLSKELVQIKKDYHKKLEKIVKEKERRLDFIKEDFASLNNDKDQLQHIVNTLTEEKEILSKKVDELKARINQSSQDKLSSMSRFEENRQKELENLSNQIFDLQEKLRAVIEENKDVKNENRKIVEEYESACKEVKADYDRIKEEERRVKNELQEMQAIFDDLQQQYLEKEEENRELATQVEKLRKELEAKEQLIPTLKGNVDGISREVAEKNREIKSIQSEFERLKNENLSNEQEFKKLQKDHDRLTCQHSYLKQEEAALQEELQIVQHKLDCEIQESRHLRNEYENLSNIYKTKEHDNGGYQRKLRDKDEEIEIIKDEYEKEIQALRKLYDSMKKDSLSKSQEAQRIQQEYETSQRNLLEQLQELQMLRITIDDSKEKALTSQQELGRTRNEYNVLQEDYFAQEREAKNLREEIEELRVRRVHDSQRIEDLTRECKGLQQKLAKEAEEIKTLEEDCRIYKNQKSGINQELSALAKQYQEMHNESTAKQQEIEALKDQILEIREKWIVAQETRDLLARDCQHWESKYELKEEDFAKLKIEAEGLKRSIMEQDYGYEDLRRQIEVLQLEATKTKSVCESLRAENDRSLAEIEKLSSVVVKQEEELEELRRERNRLKNERNRLSGELEEYQQNEMRMKEQVDLRMRSVGQLERRSCSPEKDRRANQGSRRVISQLDSVLEELGIKDRKIKSLEGKLRSLNEGLVEKNEEIKIKEMIIRDKDEDCLMKEQEKSRLKEEYQILLNEKNLMDAAEKSLRNEIVKLSEEIFKVTNNRKEAKAEMKRAQKELDQENKRLTNLLRKQDEEMVNLRKEFQRLEDEIQTLTISKAEWMEKAKMNEIEQLNQENFDNLRSQYIRLSEKFESCERQLTTKEVEIKQLKQDCKTLIDERDTLQDKVENYKVNEVKLKKEIKEYSDNVSRLQEGQAKELQEIKDHYSRLNTDHKTIMRSIDSKDAQVLKLKEELDLIVTEKTKLLDEVKEYKNMTHRDVYASVEKRSKSKNERESYSIRVEDLTQRNGALSDRDYSPYINRFSSRQRDETDSRYNSIRKPNESNEKERLHFRGSYSNQKDLESYRAEAEKKNADNSGILKAFPRYSATSFLTPQRDRSSLNASRDMDSSFNGLQSSAHVLGRQRGTHNREDIDSNAVQNSIFEKEALLTRQKIYLGNSVNSSLVENEHQRSLYESKGRSLLPTPTKNTGNNESFQKYSDSKYNYTSGKSPNLKKTDQRTAHEDNIKDSTLDSYRRLTQISEKSSPNKRA